MKLIDCNTGAGIQVGVPFKNIHGEYLITKLKAGLFRADIYYRFKDYPEHQLRMPVRYMHPSFMFQRVVFFPS